jgi:uncharacterized protein YecE (DUF72 family)
MSTVYYIGTSGWHYRHWAGKFYPDKSSTREWLSYYARTFNTVEINASFYRLPLESTFVGWHNSVPPEFRFSVKASRFITHIKRLEDCEQALTTLFERAKHLGNNLGPFLYQLPGGLKRDDAKLTAFLEMLDKSCQHVIEFRDRSWLADPVFDLMRKFNTGFCIFDLPGFTSPLIVTADFAYLRFHGHTRLYSSGYSDSELQNWAKEITNLSNSVCEFYIYFNNDAGGFAIDNALVLKEILSVK